jgi:secreted trypsin-like serine protease
LVKNLVTLSTFALICLATLCGCVLLTSTPMEYVGTVSRCQPVSKGRDDIIGGEKVPFGDPDQQLVVRLMIHKSNQVSVCTATLISDHVVLTAAHCVAKVDPDAIEAKFFTAESCPVNKMRETTRTGERLVLHKDFDGSPQSHADLALVYLNDEAPPEQVRLPLLRDNDKPTSDRLLFMGFGITDETKTDSLTLRRVHKSFKDDLEFRDRALIVNQMQERGGFCRGDSGAPIIAEVWGEPFILGVNSANVGIKPMTECHTLSLAMNIAPFKAWIEKNRDALEGASWLSRTLGSPKMRN